MASLFLKFQEFVKTLAKSPSLARNPRQIQFEADVNRLYQVNVKEALPPLFLAYLIKPFINGTRCKYYNRLGGNADDKDAEEIIDMATRASLSDQQKQIQENIHCQIKTVGKAMNEILLADLKIMDEPLNLSPHKHNAPCGSGLSFAVGRGGPPTNKRVVSETLPLSCSELSQCLKDRVGYTLDIKPSQIPHEQAGQGLFLSGKADIGTVIAFYPGVTYSPAYYRYIPGYPKVDSRNPYLITRYDGIVINAQPWGIGGGTREFWNGLTMSEAGPNIPGDSYLGSERLWKFLSKPLEGGGKEYGGEVLERRNPLALGHFANHPTKEMTPNVMVCPYDFPLTERDFRVYLPNVQFGSDEPVKMKKLGNFWFKLGGSSDGFSDVPVLKTLVLVATRPLCDEEILLNYRLSNSKRQPAWYTPVDEEEDRRRWS